MRQRYQKWIEDWETRLTERDTNRIVRPFDWGLDWVHDWPGVNGNLPARKADNATKVVRVCTRVRAIQSHSGCQFPR